MQWISSLPWDVATVLRVLIGFGICQGILIKLVSSQGRRTERFLWQFSFAFLLAILSAMTDWKTVRFDGFFITCMVLGMLGSFGAFYQWKAVAISQTRNALFTFWDDIIAMSLAVIILSEASFITGPIALGIAISFLALFLFLRHEWKKKQGATGDTIPSRFYGYIAMYSVVWGVAYFGQRYAAVREFPLVGFLLAWYSGALIVAFLIYHFYRDPAEDQKDVRPIGVRGVGLIFVLAFAIFTTMALTIPAYKAPQVVVQPIFFVSEMALPIIFGVLIFASERRQFDRVNWLYFLLGAVGALLVGLSFSR